jgi:hypothetical protein
LSRGWLREGIAAAAEDRYLNYSYGGMAAQWQAEGALLPLGTLVTAFYQQDDLAAYLSVWKPRAIPPRGVRQGSLSSRLAGRCECI